MRRLKLVVFVILSFCILMTGFTISAKTQYTLTDAASKRRLSVYMVYNKVEPVGGITESKLAVLNGTGKDALSLYDGNIETAPTFDEETTVTLDMGVNIMFSQVRYYTGKLEEGGNNCLGTRFYASRDGKNFNELSVVEGTNPPSNGWNEVEFSGYGEYRYFRAVLPPKANISEIEWMGTSGYKKARQPDGRTSLSLDLCGYNEGKELPTTMLACVYNKNGIMKQAQIFEQTFNANSETEFTLTMSNIVEEVGDSYRIAFFDKKGSSPIPSALVYRVNDATSEFSLASVFGNNMMLQADKPLVVWGKAPKNCKVEVKIVNTFGGEVSKSVQVGKDSEWEVNMGSFSSGGKYTMVVKADGKSVECKNLTFGDVWICSGQSNMDYYMAAGEETAKELKNRNDIKNSNIRIYNLWNKGHSGAAMPIDNPPCDGVSWREADSDTVAYCSAVGYYFARELQAETNIPIGLINVAVGDTEINRWIEKGFKIGSFTSTDGDLYNNRIKPFEKLNIKGIILYQGEADQYRTHMPESEYSDALVGMVNSYRAKWGSDLPFYWAQLTRYKVDESQVREGQRLALQKVAVKKNTGMIALTDIFGNYDDEVGRCRDDIHPWGKKIVGERFAAYALRDCYGRDIDVSGPIYKSSEAKGNTLILSFECKGVLRLMPKEKYADKITMDKIKKGKLDANRISEFEVAGVDGKFYDATAQVEGNKVILTCKSVKEPIYARYAWGEYPEMPNLTDDTGLPSAAFTTMQSE